MIGGVTHRPLRLGLFLPGLALICAAVVWVFRPALGYGFMLLDDDLFGENPQVRMGLTRDSVAWAFTHFNPELTLWIPLTWLSLMLDVTLYGPDPGGMHLTNLALHALNTGLLGLLLFKATGRGLAALVVAALFGLHPLRVESVVWITERKDVLFLCFSLLTLGAHGWAVGRGTDAAPAWWRQLPVLGLLLCALLAKPAAIALPGLLWLVDLWPLERRRGPWALAWEKLPHLLLSGAYGVWTLLRLRAGHMFLADTLVDPFWERLERSQVGVGHYLRLTMLPRDLIPQASLLEGRLERWEYLLTLLAPLAVSGLVLILWRQRSLWTGWLWFLLALGPSLGLLPVRAAPVADRFTYLAHPGLLTALVWGAMALLAGRHPLWRLPALALAVALTVLAAGATRDQVLLWKDDLTLFRHGAAVDPNNHLIHTYLGNALINANRWSEARAAFQRAVAIAPRDAMVHARLGEALLKEGNHGAALFHAHRAVGLDPDRDVGHLLLGHVLLVMDHPLPEVVTHLERGVAVAPFPHLALDRAGLVFLKQKQPQAAEPWFRRALALAPGHGPIHLHLGLVALAMRSPEEALPFLQRAAAIIGTDTEAHLLIGMVHNHLKQYRQALEPLVRALQRTPGDIRAAFQLAWSLAALERPAEARRMLGQVLAREPDNPEALALAATLDDPALTPQPAPPVAESAD
ncbi:MAG: tetratricopeptide repeat protein [Magnetococcales bacterium]|nr:tetratricopeptide repeat protein [Magnetococcales bacterium]